ncbi:MAG: hypothetical protein NC111_07350 [Bacteroides sp.]|nr:hypothetical protein [Bacteroides sp.]MCM1414077.1 hypothetical protein [Bacteroides sp.]MCM1472324.1 hypothetical protein [Bacteroides sp.]
MTRRIRILLLSLLLGLMSVSAESLMPHFIDLVGDFSPLSGRSFLTGYQNRYCNNVAPAKSALSRPADVMAWLESNLPAESKNTATTTTDTNGYTIHTFSSPTNFGVLSILVVAISPDEAVTVEYVEADSD